MVVVMTQGDGGTSGLSPGWYFLWGGHLGGSPGLLLTLVTHMCPGWVAQGVLDGGAGWARWHFGVVVCLAPLLWGGGLGVPPGLPPVTHVGGTDYVPEAQGTLGVGCAPVEAPPAHPADTSAIPAWGDTSPGPPFPLGCCREQMGWRLLFGGQQTWILPPGCAG